ncbi:MAG TPA: hypothetical protein VLK85_28465 [Ramlibacter sp.]|nr:hypothetical protein [Ramlibacter sp.]
MALLGRAVVVSWNRVAVADRAEFTDWHTHEHMPERLAIPGSCAAAATLPWTRTATT